MFYIAVGPITKKDSENTILFFCINYVSSNDDSQNSLGNDGHKRK